MSVPTHPHAGLQRRLQREAGELAELVEEAARGRTWRLSDRIARHLSNAPLQPLEVLQARIVALQEVPPADDLVALREALWNVQVAFAAAESAPSFRLARLAARVRNLHHVRRLPHGEMQRISQLLSSMLPRLASSVRFGVDVVVPVYGGVEETFRCLDSVLGSHNATPYQLIVVDDGNSDPDLLTRLDALRGTDRIELVRNRRNLGYTASANVGLSLHPDRDVVLLNSDTRVHGDWLDRLRHAAYSDWRIATATPFSNNAEICSYPEPGQGGELPPDVDLAELDAAFASLNEGRTFTLPTSIGFCTYMRRSCLDDVGTFDERHFPRGYGEENDFSMRARNAGWRHVIAADVFVEHVGGASFGPAKAKLVRAAVARVKRLHPRYGADVDDFVAEDSLLEPRRRVDLARTASTRASVLMVSHSQGGGTERHVNELAARLNASGVATVILRPGGDDRVRLEVHSAPSTPNLVFSLPAEDDALLQALRGLGVALVHFHHLLGVPQRIAALPHDLGVEYDVSLHDYFSICPRVYLVDNGGRYCGEPETNTCDRCVASGGSVLGSSVDVAQHRSRSHRFLAGARKIFVPSRDVAVRMQAYCRDLTFSARPHFRVASRPISVPQRSSEPLRVAVIGAIGVQKGAEVLEACLQDAEARRLPIHFCLIGYSDRDRDLLASRRITITGPYPEDEAFEWVERSKCHLAFLPSVWPETFCYTLSIAFAAGLYPVCFDLGAQRERITQAGFGELLPLASTPSAINDALLAIDPPECPEKPLANTGGTYVDIWKDYYGAPFETGDGDPHFGADRRS